MTWGVVRTCIEIDDRLMRRAMRGSGGRNKRDTIEAGLRLLIQVREQVRIRRLRGKISWEGDLNTLRLGGNARR